MSWRHLDPETLALLKHRLAVEQRAQRDAVSAEHAERRMAAESYGNVIEGECSER